MSSGMYFFNAGNTPQNNRENLQQAHSSKSNTGFGRIRLRPKNAFGELQNVIHNKTPLKGSLKPQAFASSPFVTQKSASVLAPVKKRAIPAHDREDLECAWLENSLMTVSKFKDKIQKGEEKKKKQREDEWKKLGEELIRVHKQKPDEKIFDKNRDMEDLLEELCVLEPSCLTPPSIPDLPLDDFDTDDFFKW